ncbi:MAG: hypothetical protein ABI578_01425 [Chloroflexota bacterium]
MRVSLTARFVSHPSIDFGARRAAGRRRRLGLDAMSLTYHPSAAARHRAPTIASLRSQTSRFRFPSVGSVGRVSPRRALLPLGLPRARRS